MNEQTENDNEKGKHRSRPFPIVAIGASAGGLQAVSELLRNLSPQTGMAYVYVQHLDPDHKSNLVEILQRETQMKVVQADNLMPIEADHLFIIPPNKDLSIVDGVLKVSQREPKPAIHLPVDRFFLSMAEKQKEGSIGIILSGTASDGALGLKAIKAAGGLTYAQDKTAQFQSMPEAAVAEDAVDAVLPPKEIANELERISKQAHLLVWNNEEDEKEPKEEHKAADEASVVKEPDISPIYKLLKKELGVDFSHYKISTIQRRIIRRVLLNKHENLQDYVESLKNNKAEIKLLYQDLLINVTHFFRDEDTCEYLKNELLPKLLKTKSVANPLRIWVPACSTGEEAYSLAMLIFETLGDSTPNNYIQIFGSDLSEKAIEKARKGTYLQNELANVSPERLQKFFDKVDGHYRVKKSIRERCIFAPHNILKDPPFSRIDLVSCCNLLIYLDTILQKKIFVNFHYSLNKSGYLVLGKSETIGSSTHLFTPMDRKIKIFEKKSNVTAKALFDPSINSTLTEAPVSEIEKTSDVKEITNNINLERIIDSVLLSQYTPPSVVVTTHLDIVQFRGSTGLFLEPAPGRASLNLLKMARSGLALELRNATHKVIKTGQPEKKTGIELTYNGNLHQVGFDIKILENVPGEQLLLIVFNEVKAVSLANQKTSFSKDRRVKQLEAELVALREDMRSIVEEQEAANEELQSANEEIVSSNEELQSINEELETSKEELESSNEELLTINQELLMRNDMLAEAHEYSDAIIATIREAVIVLDGRMRVKTANTSFYNTFKLKEEETEGRLIYEIGNRQWNIPRVRKLIEDILPNNSNFYGFEVAHTFPEIGEKIMVLNAKKLVQNTNKQEYILLAIQDITEHKQAEKLIEEREAWLRKMSDNVPVMIWVANQDRNFTFLNKTWLAFTGRTLLHETGIGWTEGIYKEDVEPCLSLYNASFSKRVPFSIEYRMRRHDGEYRWILNSAVPTYDANGEFTGYTGSCIEIHDKRVMSEELEKLVDERTHELKEANLNLERSNNDLAQFAYVASHDLQEPLRKIITFSSRLRERFGTLLPDGAKEFIERINNSAERMRNLIDDLLNFSRISRFDKNVIKVDLDKVLKDVLSDFDLLVQEKNAILHIDRLPVIQAVPLQMNQLFHNLVANALKFTRAHVAPEILILCRTLSENDIKKYPNLNASVPHYEITFRDNGIGFPQEFADQIFIIFQRLNEKGKYPGTGIGLALCRKIVRNHHGEIYAESRENEGSTFYVILPAQHPGKTESENAMR